MSMDVVDKALSRARPGRFVSIYFTDDGGDARVAWGYVDQYGNPHKGITFDYDGATVAASVYGFKLNAEGVTA